MRICVSTILFILLLAVPAVAQSGEHTLWGDITVDESQMDRARPTSFQVTLYSEAGQILMRQTVPSNGRYRFLSLRNGRYQVVVEIENVEIGRITVSVQSPFKNDFRHDIELQWKNTSAVNRASVVSAADYYARSSGAAMLFKKAVEASDKKHYDQAITNFQKIVETDPADFPAWQQLGTIHFILKEFGRAEECYLKALQLRGDSMYTLIGLGRLQISVQKYKEAVAVLEHAAKLQPESLQANYFLGEAYLQLRLGSKAVPFLNQAIKLDPVGMAEVHLRLAALYNAGNMKDKAALEYSEFLKQRPEYPARKKLEEYIATYKKPSKPKP